MAERTALFLLAHALFVLVGMQLNTVVSPTDEPARVFVASDRR